MEGLRVAFAGHIRPEDLGDPAAAKRQLQAAFELLRGPHGILLTGLAGGADTLAAEVWREGGMGEIHAVLPFLDAPEPPAAAEKITWLDGAATEATGRSAHLAQTRWLLEDADLLVTLWTGEEPRGAGGTADAVRVALQRGLTVLWIKPGEVEPARLIFPETLDLDFGFAELIGQLKRGTPPLVRPATKDLLEQRLDEPRVRAPAPLPEAGGDRIQSLLDRTLWRAFALYRRGVGGRPDHGAPPAEPPPSLTTQAGFTALTKAYRAHDSQAGRLAAVHRSQQVFQSLMMILAVAIGASPAIWPQIKIYAVYSELVVALVTFLVWLSAVRSQRSRRWGEARRIAEQLRLERAAWALGLSTRGDRHAAAHGAAARRAWAWRRAAGSPEGRFDADRVRQWSAWALEELILGQIAYHRSQGHLNHRLAHRGHVIENVVFWGLVGLLLTYVVAHALAERSGVELPHWFGGIVLMSGAVTPAFGAASLALDASLAFSDQSRRSEQLRGDLQALADEITPDASLETLQRVARAAIRLQLNQEENWSDEAAHRHIVRGG